MKKIWNFLVSVVRAIFRPAPKPTLQPLVDKNGNVMKPTRTARDIMGRNFFGIEEAIKYFKIHPTKAERAALSRIPFTMETLEACRHTHILVAVFPLSIMQIRGMYPNLFRTAKKQFLYEKKKFAKDAGEIAEWCLIKIAPTFGAMFNKPEMQRAALGKTNIIPSVRAMVYTIIGRYLAEQKYIFSTGNILFSDKSKTDRRVVIGFNGAKMSIYYYYGAYRPSVKKMALGTIKAVKAELELVN